MTVHGTQQICQSGVVDRVVDQKVFVKIEAQAACGHCRAKSHCGMVESAGKIAEVYTDDALKYAVGQQVELLLERSLGYKALLLGYIYPFLVLVVSLFVAFLITGSEGLSALIAVSLMVPYYAILYRNRDKLRSIFRFRIR